MGTVLTIQTRLELIRSLGENHEELGKAYRHSAKYRYRKTPKGIASRKREYVKRNEKRKSLKAHERQSTLAESFFG